MRRALPGAAAALLLAAFFVAPSPAAALAPSCPRIVSHLTSKLIAPENTVAGINATAATGATGVEMDVQWSSSGFPVLMHDATVDRTTNGTGTPASLGLGQLRALSAADYAPWIGTPFHGFNPDGTPKTPVPYGYEFMDAASVQALDVILDVHATPTQVGMDKLEIYVNDYFVWAGRTVVMGSAANVQAMNGWEPGLRYAVIEYPPTGRVYTPEYLLSIGAGAYVVPWDRITAGLVDYHHAAGLEVYAWTSDSPSHDVPARWLALANAGADVIITNQPAAAKAVLTCHAPTSAPTTAPTTTAPTTQPTTTAPTTQPTTTAPTTTPTVQPSVDPTVEPSEEG